MDQTVKYADILTEVLRAQAKLQFPTIPRLRLIASCDRESGQFLLVMIGWDNRDHWHHSITFHAQLIGDKVITEVDMTEDLKPSLIEAGICEEDLLSSREYYGQQDAKIAA